MVNLLLPNKGLHPTAHLGRASAARRPAGEAPLVRQGKPTT
jgi:hypothetical protein